MNTNALLLLSVLAVCDAVADDVAVNTTIEEHPLLRDTEFPDDFNKRNLLVTKCSHYTTEKYDYLNFTRLSDIDGVTPPGYIVRMPLYVQGNRDALIQFSRRVNPSPSASVYEFLLGDEFVEISRKRGYDTLLQIPADDFLAENQPTKFVLEVTTDGHIRVWSELDKFKPLASAFDPNPLQVKYVSFAIYEPAKMEFFYNCQL